MDAIATDLPSKVEETLAVCPRFAHFPFHQIEIILNFNLVEF